MITIRKSEARGHGEFGWLDTRHTFSFGHYFDPAHMGFSHLRVINEDRVQPGEGFPTHSHRDMEIISYVLEGALAHKDSTGAGDVLRPGDVQHMTAGSGVTHSEMNPSKDERVHFLQIWIVPARAGLKPAYAQRHFAADEKRGRLRAIAASDGRDGALRINQDAIVYATLLEKGQQIEHALAPGRKAWVQVARGKASVNGVELRAGDGAAIEGERSLSLGGDGAAIEGERSLSLGGDGAELLLFDLAG